MLDSKNSIPPALLRLLFRSRAALAGAAMLALLSPILVISTLFDVVGGIENPYFSLLTYLVLGPLAGIALILIGAGALRARTKGEIGSYSYELFKEQLTIPERYGRIRRLGYTAVFLVSSFLLFLGVVVYSGHRYTDSVQFCGTFCHSVMAPEFAAYQNSPHSRVGCFACHIGKKAGGLARARFTGLKQLYATMSGTYPRPLPTPLSNLRPTRRMCEECHPPGSAYASKIRVIDSFLPDARNTRVQTAMIMKIGSGGRRPHGIHWHASGRRQIFYEAADPGRRRITRVVLKDGAGNSTIFSRPGGRTQGTGTAGRAMDCIDCHNRPAHAFLPPGQALDRKLLNGQIPAGLPFIKREALAAITRSYPDNRTAMEGIARQLRRWYLAHPDPAASRKDLVEQAVRGAQQAYAENVFPEMGISWETYPDFLGHRNGGGCFRCHDGSFRSASGKTISNRCDLCHILLSGGQTTKTIPERLEDAVDRESGRGTGQGPS